MLVLLVQIVSATQQISFESATVSRLVGSPDEMEAKLKQDLIDLKHSAYFTTEYLHNPFYPNTKRFRDVRNVLNANFPGESEVQYPSFSYFSYILNHDWDWEEANEVIENFSKDSFLILEADGDFEDGEPVASSYQNSDEIGPKDLWESDFDKLILFDSDYAGIHLPSLKSSFVDELGETMIAPTAISDKEFVRVFVCNLGFYKKLSEVYRSARNNYYWNTNRPSGLALMSYELYGNPLNIVDIPIYDSSEVEEYCATYTQEFNDSASAQSLDLIHNLKKKTPDFGIQSLFTNLYTDEITCSIEDYSVSLEGNYSIISIPGMLQKQVYDQLVLPKKVIASKFPFRSVVNNVSLLELNNPVDINVNDLPTWQAEYVNRVCYNNTQEAGINFAHSFTENEEAVLVEVNPVEVLNCDIGQFRLYREVKFAIDYLPGSPLIFDTVTIPDEILPGENSSVTVSMKNMRTEPVDGIIVLRDGDQIISQRNFGVTGGGGQTVLPFTAADEEGFRTYTLEFWHENESKTEVKVDTRIVLLDTTLLLPVTAPSTTTASLLLFNKQQESLITSIKYYLQKDGQVLQSGEQIRTLGIGLNIVDVQFFNLTKQDQSYDLIIDLIYEGKSKTLYGGITTNHVPNLKYIPDVVVDEGKPVFLNLSASDIDHDYLTYTVTGPFDNNGVWYTAYNDSGNYTITVTASDGLLQDTQDVDIEVIDKEDPKKVIFRDCNFGDYRSGFAEVAVDFDFDDVLESWYFTHFRELEYHFGFTTNEGWPVGTSGYLNEYFCIEDSNVSDPDWYGGGDDAPDAVFSIGGTCLSSSLPNATYKGHEVCEGNINCTYPFCSFNHECGSNGWVGEFYCSNNSVIHDYRTHTCIDAATDDANCTSDDEAIQLENCSNGQQCYGGLCMDVECYNNSDCGNDGYLPNYCMPNGAYRDYRTYTCNNIATVNSSCSYDDVPSFIETCDINHTCIFGQCVGKNITIQGYFVGGDLYKDVLFTQSGSITYNVEIPQLAEVRSTQIVVEGGP